ncbi:MAG: gamma-glutamyltransferase [Melioribacteraceae bacterium]|nr:gamma-glutamyltransferase [Melioribacteraceae bacterium]
MNISRKRRAFNLFLLIFFNVITSVFPISGKPVSAKNGMVVSASTIASKVGVEILKEGGNAIDASVAVGFALAVTYPYAGNIGGGGFMVIHFNDGKSTTIDFRETAPLSANKNMFLDSTGSFVSRLSEEGATSAGVPGSVSGLIYALEKYGTLPLSKVIQPAIDLAENGWILQEHDSEAFKNNLPIFNKYPSSLKVFSKEGKPYVEGDLFIQNDLAWTLEQIKEFGIDGFYKGKVAELLVNQINELGGYITLEDLEKYNCVEREPIFGNYRGYKVISMPPPSSGGIALVELLNILENFDFDGTEWGSSEYIRALVESMKYVYADRTQHLGDSDFYPVPTNELISKEYAKTIYQQVISGVTPSSEITSGIKSAHYESEETTHYSVIDKEGNAVSVTTTINSGFGSKVVVDGAGFLLNNEMDDFSSKPGEPNQYGLLGSDANSIEPGKRMLSSMTPTIILKNDKPFLIVGSPGGSTIITVVLQVILNCIEFGMNIQEAVNAPRIHHQWLPDIIYHEQFSINNDTFSILESLGYIFKDRNSTFRVLGSAQAIMIDQDNNEIFGASDPRRNGSAEGY